MKKIITILMLPLISVVANAKNEIPENELRNYSAQSGYNAYFDKLNDFFTFDEVIEGVHHSKNPIMINSDGSITQTLPYLIERLEFNDIRLTGKNGESFGSIVITNLRMDITTTTRAKD